MKNIRLFLVTLVILFTAGETFGQVIPLNLKATMLKRVEKFEKGEEVTFNALIQEVTPNNEYGQTYIEQYLFNSEHGKLHITDKLRDQCQFHPTNVQELWNSYIVTDVFKTIQKKGFQRELRQEMEDDALQYIAKLKELHLDFSDPFLENYIYGLVAKIAPRPCIDGRTNDLNIVLAQDPCPNACTYPNGAIVINTGLLAAIHTEDELVAVLAHEIAHYVLEHGIQNVNKAIARQKRAEFWASFGTVLTATTELAIASNNSNYIPGIATLGVAAISSSLASEINNRLGMKFSQEQEKRADQVAIDLLKILGYNENALANLLLRIDKEEKDYQPNSLHRDWDEEPTTHPSLEERVAYCKNREDIRDERFEQLVSFAVTNVASINYFDRRFTRCINFITQNINNQVATAEDYLLKANCLMLVNNTEESNQQVADLIAKAREIKPNGLGADKTEILLTLRMKKYEEAMKQINQYKEELEQLTTSPSCITANTCNYLSDEISWCKAMLAKLRGMTRH